jgi:hypothetical protein
MPTSALCSLLGQLEMGHVRQAERTTGKRVGAEDPSLLLSTKLWSPTYLFLLL